MKDLKDLVEEASEGDLIRIFLSSTGDYVGYVLEKAIYQNSQAIFFDGFKPSGHFENQAGREILEGFRFEHDTPYLDLQSRLFHRAFGINEENAIQALGYEILERAKK